MGGLLLTLYAKFNFTLKMENQLSYRKNSMTLMLLLLDYTYSLQTALQENQLLEF